MWATLHSIKLRSRGFDIGSNAGNNICIAWSQGVDPLNDRIGFTVNGVETRADRTLAPFTINLQRHIVPSIDGGGGAGGATKLSICLDGVLRESFETTYRLQDLVDTKLLPGAVALQR